MSSVFNYFVILPHANANQPAILMLSGPDGWSLPGWQTGELIFWQSTGYVNSQVLDLLGVRAVTLRALHVAQSQSGNFVRIYDLENLSPKWVAPANSKWIKLVGLNGLKLAQPEQRDLLENWFKEAAEGYPERRRTWARKGWFEEATQWITGQLTELGFIPDKPLEQVRSWERSCVLRQCAGENSFYFKVVPPMFSHEPRLQLALGNLFPASFPQILSFEPARNWFLMEDFGGHSLEKEADLTHWKAALQRYAQLQKASIAQTTNLLEFGCPNGRLEKLAAQIQPFLAELPGDYPLSREEVEQLQALLSQLIDDCRELAGFNLPLTLDHGDFWPSNISVNEAKTDYLFFDWSDATITHPFFSVSIFVRPEMLEETAQYSSDPAIRQMLQDPTAVSQELSEAYLQAWTGFTNFADKTTLRQTFQLAGKLAPLYYALLYHFVILPGMEVRWEMRNMVAFYLRMLLV